MARQTEAMRVVAALGVGLLLTSAAPSLAQLGGAGLIASNVALGCRVQDEKVLVITNTTGATIASGTPITFDTVRKPDRAHFGRTFQTNALLPGSSVRISGFPSFSCTAWFKRTPVLAPLR
jgi:hypothetical protein